MAQQPPAPQTPAPAAAKNSAPKKDAPAAPVKKEPGLPDERLWVKYSPHHELPLSSVSSFTAHVLAVGMLVICASCTLFNRNVHEVPVEAVRLDAGGGGRPHGADGATGPGSRPPEEVGETNKKPDPNPETEKRPDLERIKSPDFQAQFNDDARRFINQPNPPPNLGKVALLDESVRRKIQPGPATDASKGRGGDGSGGGRGGGKGTGEGDRSGPGKSSGSLTQREKRMLRWTMMFDTDNGRDYLAQLRGLGAILAIPTNEEKREFKLVKKLTPPAHLEEEDITKINRIYWVDETPESVRQLMAALGLKIRPNFFVAFMPEELENKLYQLEKAAAKGRPEDDIRETKFRVKRSGDRFEPVFASIAFK
jgi:hypothetical protein